MASTPTQERSSVYNRECLSVVAVSDDDERVQVVLMEVQGLSESMGTLWG